MGYRGAEDLDARGALGEDVRGCGFCEEGEEEGEEGEEDGVHPGRYFGIGGLEVGFRVEGFSMGKLCVRSGGGGECVYISLLGGSYWSARGGGELCRAGVAISGWVVCGWALLREGMVRVAVRIVVL